MLVSDMIIALGKVQEAVPVVQLRVSAEALTAGDLPALRIDGIAAGPPGKRLRVARLITLAALESATDPEAYFTKALWIVIAELEKRANPQRRTA